MLIALHMYPCTEPVASWGRVGGHITVNESVFLASYRLVGKDV